MFVGLYLQSAVKGSSSGFRQKSPIRDFWWGHQLQGQLPLDHLALPCGKSKVVTSKPYLSVAKNSGRFKKTACIFNFYHSNRNLSYDPS